VSIRSSLLAWTGAAALTTLVAQAQAPTPPADQAGSAFRSTVSLVALTVTVQDSRARYVTDLQPSDFAIYEDGVRQEVRFFKSDTLPVDLIVLLDTSRSMAGKVDSVRDAATLFLDTLRPGDRGAVVTFSERVTVTQPLTGDRDALARALQSVRASGNTALHSAVYVALKTFSQTDVGDGAVRRQALAVLSDGADTASGVSFDRVVALAQDSGVNVYTVRLRSPGERATPGLVTAPQFFSEAEFEMKALARETGALSFSPTLNQLSGVYSSIAQEIASQYSIGYQPGDGARPAGFHKVSVQIVTRPGLRARTRTGYSNE
jgi:Ca-activated chloride channel homolog